MSVFCMFVSSFNVNSLYIYIIVVYLSHIILNPKISRRKIYFMWYHVVNKIVQAVRGKCEKITGIIIAKRLRYGKIAVK